MSIFLFSLYFLFTVGPPVLLSFLEGYTDTDFIEVFKVSRTYVSGRSPLDHETLLIKVRMEKLYIWFYHGHKEKQNTLLTVNNQENIKMSLT